MCNTYILISNPLFPWEQTMQNTAFIEAAELHFDAFDLDLQETAQAGETAQVQHPSLATCFCTYSHCH